MSLSRKAPPLRSALLNRVAGHARLGSLAPSLLAPSSPVVQQVGGSMRQQRVALHLSKADAAAKLAALDGLPGERVDGARGPNL